METTDKVEELIAYLKSLGFEGEKLATDIREQYEKLRSKFTIKHQIEFGDEVMHYELHFVHDRQFRAYRLTDFDAVHRDPVIIDHKTVNGVDTAGLEKEMSEIDWHHYFHCEMNGLEFGHDLSLLFKKLWALSDEDNPNPEGLDIQNKLIYKYWPSGNWNDEADELQPVYELKRTFKANELGTCNAILAYHLVSGTLNNLYALFKDTGIEQYSGIDLKSLLTVYLSSNEQSFEIACSHLEKEGVIDFKISVQKGDDRYYAEENCATFTYFPEITHGVFNGVDSRELEEQMKKIDWNADEQLYEFDEQGDVVLLPDMQSIRDSIEKLSTNEQSKDIADYLRIKYWFYSFMEVYVPEDTWQMKNWPRVEHHFSLEDDTKTIANLMRGRFVHADSFNSLDYDMDSWLFIDRHKKMLVENSAIGFVQGPTRAQVETMVNMLPRDGTVYAGDIVRSIMQGNETSVNLSAVDGQQQVVVSIDPNEKILELQTPDGHPIPFNFRLQPYWKPATTITLEMKKGKEKKEKPQVKSIKSKRNSPKM